MKYFLTLLWLVTSIQLYSQQTDSVYQELYARASANLENGSYKNAVLELNQMVNSNIANGEVYLKRGIAHFYLNEYQLAGEDFSRAQKEGLRTAEFFGFRGMNYYSLDQHDKAAADLESAASLGFANPEIHFMLGNIKFTEERYQQAITHYETARNKGYSDPVLFNNKGKALYLIDRKADALKDYNKSLEMREDYPVAIKNRAVVNFDLENWQAAYEDFTKVIAAEPSVESAYLLRGKSAFQLEKYAEAIEDLKKAEARGAGDDESTFLIAEAFYRESDFKNAAIYFDKEVRKNNKNTAAWQKLGISLYRQQQYSNAVKALKSADGESAEVAGYLGLSLYNSGESEEAYKYLSRITGSGFPETEAYVTLGEMLMKKKAYAQAMSTYSQLITLDEASVTAYLGRARAQVLLNKSGGIDADIEKAVSISDGQEVLTEAGLIYFAASDNQKTITYLSQVEKPSDEAKLSLGLALFETGELTRALPVLEAAAGGSVDRDRAILPLAVCYYSGGDLENAHEYFSRAETLSEIPGTYAYAYTHAAFVKGNYAKVLSLSNGLNADNPPVEIARMRAVSAFELKQFPLALQEAKKAAPDETIRHIGGLSAFNTQSAEDVITFLSDEAGNIERLEALAWANQTKENTTAAHDTYTRLIALNASEASYYVERGLLNKSLDDKESAVADFTEALTINPELIKAREERGIIAYEVQKYPTAIEDFVILADRNPGAETIYMLGMSYWYTDAPDQAIPYLAQAYDKGYAKADMAAILGEHYFNASEFEKALDRLNKAIHLGDESETTLLLRGRSQYKLGNYTMAVADLLQVKTETFEGNAELGHALYETDDFEKAREILTKATALNPSQPETWFHLGNSEFRLDDYTPAIKAYEMAIEKGMKSEILFNNVGKAHYNLNQFEESVPYFTKALEMDETYARARFNRGQAYFNLKNFGDAIGDFELLDAGEYPQVNRLIGDSYFEEADYSSALKYFNRAIDGGDKSGEVYHRRGRTLMAVEQYPTALGDLNNAIAAGKKDVEVYLDRARVNIYLGNDPAAMKDLNEVISLDPENAVAYYNRGYLRELQENFNEAIRDYRKVVAIDAGDHRAYFSMANSMVSLGQVSAALEPIEKAITLKSDEPSYFKVKGNITYRLERTQEACGLWQKAVDLGDQKSNFYINQYCK